ncbi:MAG: hypothetical protein L6420_05380 [Elusimicrobia bacterium]|nr:hypothetical protein [Elusimicrobiota bacterium]
MEKRENKNNIRKSDFQAGSEKYIRGSADFVEKREIEKASSFALSFLNELKKFNEKLWLERNTVSVELGAIIEEFEADIQAETDYSEKCWNTALEKVRNNSDKYEKKIDDLKVRQNNLLECISKLESDKKQNEDLNKAFIAELEEQINIKNEECSKLKIRFALDKEILDSDYSSKVTKLYDELSRKHKVLVDKWVAKNENLKSEMAETKREYEEKFKILEEKERKLESELNIQKEEFNSKISAMEKKYEEKVSALRDKETRLESDFNAKKEELNSKIEVVTKGYEDRLKNLDEKEKALKKNFNSQKAELVKTFERVRLDFEEREKKLKEKENQ